MDSIKIITFLKKRFLLQAIFWLVYLGFLSLGYIFSSLNKDLKWIPEFLVHALVDVSLVLLNLLLVSRLFYNKKYILFAIALLLNSFVISFLYGLSYQYFNITVNDVTWLNFFPYYIFLSCLVLSLKFAKNAYIGLYLQMKRNEELLFQQLSFLKNQINSHFLFNTLNNFYGLALSKSDKLPGLMIQLSNLLRYQIYDSNEKFILLSSEIEYVKNYIELESIRLGGNFHGEFSFPDEKEIINIRIAPLILNIFIENAFKHSKNSINNKITIKSQLSVKNNVLHFLVENSTGENLHVVSRNDKKSQGVGFENVRKRLSILYPGKHELNITIQKQSFAIGLTLDVSANEKN